MKEDTLQVSTVPVKDSPADIGTKLLKEDNVQTFAEWLNLRDEEMSEDAKEKRRPEAEAIAAFFGMAMVLLGNRRHAIMRSILTAASAANVCKDNTSNDPFSRCNSVQQLATDKN